MKATRIIDVKAVWSVVLLACAGQAYASECAVFDALDDLGTMAIVPNDAKCTTYLTKTANMGVSCFWDFPYRSDAAHRFFETTWRDLRACREGEPRKPDDRVNHPDSYALREWMSESGVYAVSKKDKAALSRTLVFLRFEPRN